MRIAIISDTHDHILNLRGAVKYCNAYSVSMISHHGILGAVEAGGLRIAFTHYPQLARGIACQGLFDLVCCGHNHRYQVEKVGDCLLINPGELLGKDEQPGFCILQCETKEVERVEIGSAIEDY